MNLTQKEKSTTRGGSFGRRPAIMAILLLAVAGFVAVATALQAIRQHSLGPIWAAGWLPAVLVAALWTPVPRKSCRPRLRGPARR